MNVDIFNIPTVSDFPHFLKSVVLKSSSGLRGMSVQGLGLSICASCLRREPASNKSKLRGCVVVLTFNTVSLSLCWKIQNHWES